MVTGDGEVVGSPDGDGVIVTWTVCVMVTVTSTVVVDVVVVHTRADVLGAAGVVVVIIALFVVADADGVPAVADAAADIESVGSVIALPVSLDDGAGSELTDTAAAVDFGEPPLEMM